MVYTIQESGLYLYRRVQVPNLTFPRPISYQHWSSNEEATQSSSLNARIKGKLECLCFGMYATCTELEIMYVMNECCNSASEVVTDTLRNAVYKF